MSTVQLRRYRIAAGHLDDFAAWFPSAAATRRPFGFAVEFAYLDRDVDEFVWAVSHRGGSEDFADAESRWKASPERAAVFAEMPDCVVGHHVSMVQPLPTT